jgi:hypothetical protein
MRKKTDPNKIDDKKDIGGAIDKVGGKPADNGSGEETVVRRRRRKVEDSPTFTVEQLSTITDGLFMALSGITRLPFDQAEPKLKAGFDMALTQVANQYGGEVLQKWAPLLQLSICASLLTVDVVKKKKEAEKAKGDVEEN